MAHFAAYWPFSGAGGALQLKTDTHARVGYGDITPASNAGKAFFVIWSLLAVPSLTILISNMGDTIVKWFTDVTELVARLTVLPGEDGFRSSLTRLLSQVSVTVPGILGDTKRKGQYLRRAGRPVPWRALS